ASAQTPGICDSFRNPVDHQQCQQIYSETHFFDRNAVSVCGSFPFSSDRLACLRAIANKLYENSALQTCRNLDLSSRRLHCLTRNGRNFKEELPASLCVKINVLESDLKQSMFFLTQGDAEKTYQILESLLRQVQSCRSINGAIH